MNRVVTRAHEPIELPARATAEPAGFEPFLLRRFLDEPTVARARLEVARLKRRRSPRPDREIYFRRAAHNHPFFVKLHERITPRAEALLARRLKRTYVFTAMYLLGEGRCPRHTDRPQCKYTLDVCLDQTAVWPIFVACGESAPELRFELEPGDAVVMSGTEHPHRRDPIDAENFCDLAFFHFVDPDFTGSLR